MATHVLSCYGLRLAMSLGPSAPYHSPTKIVRGSTWASIGVAAQDVYLERHSRRPVRLRKGLVHESISVIFKLSCTICTCSSASFNTSGPKTWLSLV
jgi:hypothetical protein